MIELYQAFGDYTDVMAITEELIVNAARDALGTTVVTIGGTEVDLAEPWPRGGWSTWSPTPPASRCTRRSRSTQLRALAGEHGVAVSRHGAAARSSRSCSRPPSRRR